MGDGTRAAAEVAALFEDGMRFGFQYRLRDFQGRPAIEPLLASLCAAAGFVSRDARGGRMLRP